MKNTNRILCVDDDKDTCDLVNIWLKMAAAGFDVVTSGDYEDALSKFDDGHFCLIILDSWLPGGSGVELCREVRKTDKETPILFFSADAFTGTIEEATSAGADEYLTKPVERETFVAAVKRLCDSKRQTAETQASGASN